MYYVSKKCLIFERGVLKKSHINPIKGHFPGGNVRGIRATTSIAAAIDTLIWIELPFYAVLREDLKNNDFR